MKLIDNLYLLNKFYKKHGYNMEVNYIKYNLNKSINVNLENDKI